MTSLIESQTPTVDRFPIRKPMAPAQFDPLAREIFTLKKQLNAVMVRRMKSELPPKLSLFFLIAAGCFLGADLALVRLIDGRRQPSSMPITTSISACRLLVLASMLRMLVCWSLITAVICFNMQKRSSHKMLSLIG